MRHGQGNSGIVLGGVFGGRRRDAGRSARSQGPGGVQIRRLSLLRSVGRSGHGRALAMRGGPRRPQRRSRTKMRGGVGALRPTVGTNFICRKPIALFADRNQRKRTTAGLAPDRCRSGRRQAGAATSGLFQRDQSTLITILPKCPLAA